MKLGKFYHLARCGKCCKRDELNLGGDQVEDSLALEHVEVCLHLLKVGEALVLEEGIDGGQHLLQDLSRFAQPVAGVCLRFQTRILARIWRQCLSRGSSTSVLLQQEFRMQIQQHLN